MKKVPMPIRVIVIRKVYLRPIMSPRRPKISAPDRRHGKARSEGEQREDEADGRRHAREEILGEESAKRAVDIEVVPLEDGAERRRENDLSLPGRPSTCADTAARCR